MHALVQCEAVNKLGLPDVVIDNNDSATRPLGRWSVKSGPTDTRPVIIVEGLPKRVSIVEHKLSKRRSSRAETNQRLVVEKLSDANFDFFWKMSECEQGQGWVGRK